MGTSIARFFVMSASAICDAMVTALAAASAFGPGGAATHYAILESTSGSAVVVQWTALTSLHDQFGKTTSERAWTITADVFVKDTGDPFQVGNRRQGCIDTVIKVVEADDTIQGTVSRVAQIRGSRELPDDDAFSSGGFTWRRQRVDVDLVEWPDG